MLNHENLNGLGLDPSPVSVNQERSTLPASVDHLVAAMLRGSETQETEVQVHPAVLEANEKLVQAAMEGQVSSDLYALRVDY